MEPPGTSHEVLRLLLDGPATAQALAARLGVDVAAARRHLEAHLAEGRVDAAFRQEGVGRPRKYYEITRAGRETMPRRYDLLAQLLLDALAEGSPEARERVMADLARRLASDVERRIPPDADAKGRARALVHALRDMGFPTELEARGDRLVLRRRDCAFLRVADAHPALCREFDTRLVRLVMREEVALRACLPEGAACCLHEVALRRND